MTEVADTVSAGGSVPVLCVFGSDSPRSATGTSGVCISALERRFYLAVQLAKLNYASSPRNLAPHPLWRNNGLETPQRVLATIRIRSLTKSDRHREIKRLNWYAVVGIIAWRAWTYYGLLLHRLHYAERYFPWEMYMFCIKMSAADSKLNGLLGTRRTLMGKLMCSYLSHEIVNAINYNSIFIFILFQKEET